MITPEQREQRRRYIGASDVPALFGYDPFRTAADVAASKLFPLQDVPPNEAMELGNALEPGLVALAGRKLGVEFSTDPAALWKPDTRDRSVLAANLDGISADGRQIVDAKVSLSGMDQWGAPGTDQIPDRVMLQVQAQFACSGAEVGHIAALIGRYRPEFALFTIYPHPVLIEQIRTVAREWWARHVVARAPVSDSVVPSSDVLAAIVRPLGKVAELTDEDRELATALAREYRARRSESKAAAEALETTRNRLIALMGDAETMTLMDGTEVSYPQRRVRAYSVPASVRRVLVVKDSKGIADE